MEVPPPNADWNADWSSWRLISPGTAGPPEQKLQSDVFVHTNPNRVPGESHVVYINNIYI